MALYGGIEAGGTKFACAVGTAPDDIIAEATIPTTTPDDTITRTISFFRKFQSQVVAIGVGSFGPIDLDRSSETFGYITNTPKSGWAQTPIICKLGRALNVPLVFDTDTNAAALGEAIWGIGKGLQTILYLTIGTGIGGGVVIDRKVLHGMLHPEIGHLRLPHDWKTDPFPGACPYHGDCLEGLASGPAVAKRWGTTAESLPSNHQAWSLEATYLALALTNLILTLSPQRIILGGGIMQRETLFQSIRTRVKELLNGYVHARQIEVSIEEYIVPPQLGQKAGVYGAIALAKGAPELG